MVPKGLRRGLLAFTPTVPGVTRRQVPEVVLRRTLAFSPVETKAVRRQVVRGLWARLRIASAPSSTSVSQPPVGVNRCRIRAGMASAPCQSLEAHRGARELQVLAARAPVADRPRPLWLQAGHNPRR